MPAKPETTFTARLHRHLPEVVYRLKTHSRYHGGVPDFYYEGDVDILWVEYKWEPRLPKVLDLTVGGRLTKLQQEWLTRAHCNNKQVAVITGSPLGSVIAEGLAWQTPLTNYTRHTIEEVVTWIMTRTSSTSPSAPSTATRSSRRR